jgi:hypothetical protein
VRTHSRRFGLRLLVAFFLVASVVVVSNRSTVGRAIGRALVAEDQVEPADVVVVPEWTQTAGALEAADLVQSGMATSVLVFVRPEQPSTQELVRRGILEADQSVWAVSLLRRLGVQTVQQIEGSDAGTRSEASSLASWCREHQVRSLIFVTTLDHSRRVGRVVRRSLRDQPTTVIIRPTRYARFDPDHWWQTRDNMRTGVVELEKLIVDVLIHPLS